MTIYKVSLYIDTLYIDKFYKYIKFILVLQLQPIACIPSNAGNDGLKYSAGI